MMRRELSWLLLVLSAVAVLLALVRGHHRPDGSSIEARSLTGVDVPTTSPIWGSKWPEQAPAFDLQSTREGEIIPSFTFSLSTSGFASWIGRGRMYYIAKGMSIRVYWNGRQGCWILICVDKSGVHQDGDRLESQTAVVVRDLILRGAFERGLPTYGNADICHLICDRAYVIRDRTRQAVIDPLVIHDRRVLTSIDAFLLVLPCGHRLECLKRTHCKDRGLLRRAQLLDMDDHLAHRTRIGQPPHAQ